MSKNIGTSLLADIQKDVQSLATCMVITRKDGHPYYLTSHDEDIVFEGKTYDHTIPFITAAFDSASQLAIDNTQITLYADGTVFSKAEFDAGLFDHADCEIFQIDFENLMHGKMTMRKGWFGSVEANKNNVIQITVTGLLKILDFETGRTYQPSCDADLGDRRCKVAVNQEQIRSTYNVYNVGDWVYNYDTSLMTAITLSNPGFESGAPVDAVSTIPGWTKGTGAGVFVNDEATEPGTLEVVGTLAPAVGTYALYGFRDATDDDNGFESFVYQDVDLVTSGISATDIDDGKISLGYFALFATNVYLLDPIKLRVELTDTDGDFVAAFDSRPMFLKEVASWTEKSLVFPVYPNARFARIFLYFKKEDGAIANVAADDVRLYWWDHTTQTPYDDAVHRLSRLITYNDDAVKRAVNHSFEAQGNVANADNTGVTGWTTGAGNWFQINNVFGSGGATLSVDNEDYFLAGGDDGSATQQDYEITQVITVGSIPLLTPSRVLLAKYVGKLSVNVGFFGNPTTSKATVKLEMLNSSDVVIDTYYALNNANYGGVTGVWQDQEVVFSVPALTTKFKITLIAHSPTGDSAARAGFDNVRLYFFDAERPSRNDPLASNPILASTDLDTTPGAYTLDGRLVWKAMPAYLQYDEVATVTDRKTFTGTAIAGVDGTYETGVIWWISGQNAGLRNVVRIWTSATKTLKMYFKQPFPITVGDRFIYVRSCQRRFTEDCQLIFQNQINFRGFPHLPGKLRNATPTENAAG